MHNFLLTPLPFHFPPDLHDFIIFPPHSFLFSSSSTIFYFPSSILNSLLLFDFIISPSCPHFILHIFPSTTTSTLYRPSSDPTLKFHTRFFFNTASWIVKLYTTTTIKFLLFSSSFTTTTFLLFSSTTTTTGGGGGDGSGGSGGGGGGKQQKCVGGAGGEKQ